MIPSKMFKPTSKTNSKWLCLLWFAKQILLRFQGIKHSYIMMDKHDGNHSGLFRIFL